MHSAEEQAHALHANETEHESVMRQTNKLPINQARAARTCQGPGRAVDTGPLVIATPRTGSAPRQIRRQRGDRARRARTALNVCVTAT
jgi:hypothetical protein